MRSRLVIPAALLVTVAYVKGRLDASAVAHDQARPPVPVAMPIDAILRAEAEAADALVIAEAQIAATGTVVPPHRPEPVAPELLREWDTVPVSPPAWRPREQDAAAAAALGEWVAQPAPRAIRAPAEDPAVLAEWATHVAGAPAPESPPAVELAPAPLVVEVVIDESGRFSLGGWAAQAGDMSLCGVTFRDRRDAIVDAASIRLIPDACANVSDGGLVVLSDAGFAPDVEGFTIVVAADGPGSFAAAGRYELLAA